MKFSHSNEPLLRSRDTTMLNHRAQDVQTERIHAFRLDGALMLKILQRLPGRILRASAANTE